MALSTRDAIPDEPVEEIHPLAFTGKGREYFGIWIVKPAADDHQLRSLFALGQRCGACNTFIATPNWPVPVSTTTEIPWPFSRAACWRSACSSSNLAGAFSPALELAGGLVLMAFLPRLLLRSLQFRLYNSSYRGLRFRFNGKLKAAYRVFLGWPLATLLTLSVLMPFCHQRIKAFQHDNAAFGRASFSFWRRYGPSSATSRFSALFCLVSA